MSIDLARIVEALGDPVEVHKGLVDYERRSDRMMAMEERLTKEHPDEWAAMARDGTVVFTSPAIANTWPRRWMPAEKGGNREPGAPRYTGDHRDGFGNLITVLAAANPVDEGIEPALLHNRAPGYGIVRFDPRSRSIILEAWRRPVDENAASEMFSDWPITLNSEGRPQ